ncbi:MAG: hypothetical protein ACMUIP_17815 [bacterium]
MSASDVTLATFGGSQESEDRTVGNDGDISEMAKIMLQQLKEVTKNKNKSYSRVIVCTLCK